MTVAKFVAACGLIAALVAICWAVAIVEAVTR